MKFLRTFYSLTLSAFLIFLPGCAEPEGESSVEGQIFVVAPGGDNVPLGLVEVFFFEEGTITGFLAQRGREIEEKRQAIQTRLDLKEGELRDTVQARQGMREELQLLESDFIERRANLIEELDRMVESKTREIEGNKDFAEDMDVIPPPPEGAPSRAEFEAYEERRRKWLSMNREERMAWRAVLLQQNVDLQASIDERLQEGEEQMDRWDDTLAQIEIILENYDDAVLELEADIANLKHELGLFPTVEDYFEDLPVPLKKTRTDANGEFSVSLPSNRKTGLIATIRREVRERDEDHAWFLWVETAQGPHERMLLSNHNSLTEISGGEPLSLH